MGAGRQGVLLGRWTRCSNTDPAGRAALLLRRARELPLECRAVAAQLEAVSGRESQAAVGERITYGVLVAPPEEGLVKGAGAWSMR